MRVPYAALSMRCPTCNSTQLFYTCTPDCCFNHLCDDCHTTFELATTVVDGTVPTGERDGLVDAPPEDTTALHAQCAACDSMAVRVDEARVAAACGHCHARLELQVVNVRPDRTP